MIAARWVQLTPYAVPLFARFAALILHELGYDAAAIAALRADEVV